MQRQHVSIDLHTRSIRADDVTGEALARAGRNLISRSLLAQGIAAVDPLSPSNPLIFSAGPLAGTNFSNANRISVGCKSPLTGGIKEANAGGTFAYALGRLNLAGFTLEGASAEWVVIHLHKDGRITFDAAESYLGLGNFEAAARLHDAYGRQVSLALCGPVGEYQGLVAGIAFSDTDRRPSRLAARGGVGAVLGSKRVKAVVADLDRMPRLHDRPKLMTDSRTYAALLLDNKTITGHYGKLGTMGTADFVNSVGGLPVHNFSMGQQVDPFEETFTMGGDFISERNLARGGVQTHACMPGCVIRCSNVVVDAAGEELCSPLEYETIGVLGTNCGIREADDLAALNYAANDLGIDTIETGATLAILMEAGLAQFGDTAFMHRALQELRAGSEEGRLWAQGAARVGRHYGVERVPVIKDQALSAYDPRVIEVTGITMMATAQGADHTAGNVPRYDAAGKTAEDLLAASLQAQINVAVYDSIGFCVFGSAVTNDQWDFVAAALNHALGTAIDRDFLLELGKETLLLERVFNEAAGFTVADDELPAFFYDEPLPPRNRTARFHGRDVHTLYDRLK